jgi:hypothetical protein
MVIADLGQHPVWVEALSRWHYDQWGPLTGAVSAGDYTQMLTNAAQSRTVPSVLVAVANGQLLSSASLVASDLPIRPAPTPWLAQLLVTQSGAGTEWVQPWWRQCSRGPGSAATGARSSSRRGRCPSTTVGSDGGLSRVLSTLGGNGRSWAATSSSLRALEQEHERWIAWQMVPGR